MSPMLDFWPDQLVKTTPFDDEMRDIILEAERHAIARWGPGRMYTYVDPAKVRSTNPGYCYLAAGWHKHGYSKGGKRLLVKYDGCDRP